MKILKLITVMFALASCDKPSKNSSIEEPPKAMFENVLRRSLDLHTFELPELSRKSEMAIIADIGGEVFYGQNIQEKEKYFTLCRSARASEMVCCSHTIDKGFSSSISFGDNEINNWVFNDPKPMLKNNKIILATAQLKDGKTAILYIGYKKEPQNKTIESD